MSAWRRSISSTKKVKQASGWRVAVVVVVACLRERHHPRSETISIRPNRIARLDGGTNMFRSIPKLPPMWRSHQSASGPASGREHTMPAVLVEAGSMINRIS